MKVKLSAGTKNYVLTLVPESEEDQKELRSMALSLNRPRMVSHRGFQYLSPEVELYIQPMPFRDLLISIAESAIVRRAEDACPDACYGHPCGECLR